MACRGRGEAFPEAAVSSLWHAATARYQEFDNPRVRRSPEDSCLFSQDLEVRSTYIIPYTVSLSCMHTADFQTIPSVGRRTFYVQVRWGLQAGREFDLSWTADIPLNCVAATINLILWPLSIDSKHRPHFSLFSANFRDSAQQVGAFLVYRMVGVRK